MVSVLFLALAGLLGFWAASVVLGLERRPVLLKNRKGEILTGWRAARVYWMSFGAIVMFLNAGR